VFKEIPEFNTTIHPVLMAGILIQEAPEVVTPCTQFGVGTFMEE